MKLYGWDHVPKEQLTPLLARQVIHTDRMTVALIHLAKGATVPEHRHEHEQCSTVERGRIHFRVAGEEIMLQAGDVLVIPPQAPHSVEALEDSLVLDLFSPPRDDWRRGDDAYLRR